MLTHADVADVLGPQGLANIIWALAALKCISSTTAPVAEASVQTGGAGWGGVGGAAAGMALGEALDTGRGYAEIFGDAVIAAEGTETTPQGKIGIQGVGQPRAREADVELKVLRHF